MTSVTVRPSPAVAFPAITVLPRVTLAVVMAATATLTLSAQSIQAIADPAFHFVASAGCVDVFLYAWNTPRSEVLTARIDIKKLGLGPGTHVIDIQSAGAAVAIEVDQYSDPDPWLRYCSDVGPSAKAVATWRAVAGKATLIIGEPGGVPGAGPFVYKATLRVDGLTIVGPDGRKLSASAPVVLSGTVGWVSG
jgi:hypothetical protein